MTLECPECGKELQARSMFKHMRLYHPSYLDRCVNVFKSEDFDELIEDSKAYPFDWTIKNDFDEEESKSIWGCLGCNATFTTELTGNRHTAGKCKKEHIKGIKEYKKEFIKTQEKDKKQKEQEKKIPSYTNDKWKTLIKEALETQQHYYNNLCKLISKIKEIGDTPLFIEKTARMYPYVMNWKWIDIPELTLPTIDTNSDNLPAEYAKICFNIIICSSQLRVLFSGLENEYCSQKYGWDWLDNVMLHPVRNWQYYGDSWLWIYFKHLDKY
jgi:hypothetical protein